MISAAAAAKEVSRGRLSAQGAGAVRQDLSTFIHDTDDLDLRHIRNRFHHRLQTAAVARDKQRSALVRETAATGIRAFADLAQMSGKVEVEIQTVIKPCRHESKDKRD